MTTLKDLLVQAKVDRAARSGRALAKIATDHGLQVHSTQVNHILAGTYRSRPSRQLLEAIAWLAQTDVGDVYAAAGLPLPGPSFAEELPPDVDHLEPHQRTAVIGVIRGFLADNQELADVRDAARERPQLPTVAQTRERRRQRVIDSGQPQTEAAYDDEDGK